MTRHLPLLLAVSLAFAGAARADEGMWTYDNFPAKKVQSAYGVRIDQPWLDRLQAASVRLTTGCSASLVSSQGLVLTNNHCVMNCTQQLSTPQEDYVKGGFLTNGREDERKCAGMQAEVLETITDVTGQIDAATTGLSGAAFVRARDAAMGVAEDAGCGADARRRCQVVTLYRGGQYKLYRYRKYADVRLVFAPEYATAFFGGDPDNFNFPRFDLDMAFLRLYEDGKPIASPQHLAWQTRAPKAGEATFVSGNPGGTERALTVAQLETQRDLALPVSLLQRAELRGRLLRFSEESPEHKRLATDPLLTQENGFKVFFGRQFALNDPALMDAKRAAEADLKAKVAADPALAARIGDPWGEIAQVQKAYADDYVRYRQLETAAGSSSDLFDYARRLVRAAQERARPATERLPEYADARLPLIRKQLLDPRPVDPALETLYLGFWLSKTREYLTVDDAGTQGLLGRESPEGLARRLVSGSTLADPAARQALWDGGLAAVAASADPMIQFVLRTDPDARAIRKAWEAEVTGPTDAAAERIARARFAVYGAAIYPDATFTLRLSFGHVEGWTYRGRETPAFTTFAGLYARATGAEPFDLAPRWIAAQPRLDPTTVYNFVTTNDIIGGNSGSPLVSARGEVLGAVFDGNIQSLGGDYGYDGAVNRTVAVSTAAATEALEKVYGRTALVKELTAR